MRVLLDTQLLVWIAAGHKKLPQEVATLMKSDVTSVHFSVVNIWEASIKQALGRTDFAFDASVLRLGALDAGFRELTVQSHHALRTRELPRLHRDPFDRMLIAQALAENLVLLTTDHQIAEYEGPIRLFA